MLKNIVGFIMMSQLILFGTVDRIQKAIEKKEYDKAIDLIMKGLEKEPLNAGISYYQSKILFDPAFKYYNIDSARIIINEAKKKFEESDQSLQEELDEDGITKEKINKLADQIRDKIFQQTLDSLSITSARRFRSIYPKSIYDEILSFKVDSIQYQKTKSIGSKESFIAFIENNPASVFKPEADSILDHLRFNDLIKSKSLSDYITFLESFPLTRYRGKVEEYILKVTTASGRESDLKSFLLFSKVSSLKKKVADVLYYKTSSKDYSFHPNTDSINQISENADIKLFPVVENNLIGFYDSNGKSRVLPNFINIPYDYKCELIKDDWIFVTDSEDGKIITKNGRELIPNVIGYESIRNDIALVQIDDEKWLYHKSGFKILNSPVQEAETLSNDWIRIRQNNKWGLATLLGLEITESRYDDIYTLGNFYVFERGRKFAVYTEKKILKEIENKGLSLEFKFDDIELVNNYSLIGFRGKRECMLDSTLNFLIPWGTYEIYPDESGWYLRSDKGYRLYNPSEADIMDQHHPYLESNDGWLALKTTEDWMLLPRIKGILPSRGYDSIKLVNENAAVLIKDDKREMLFASGKKISLTNERVLTFPRRNDFIKLQDETLMKLFSKNGEEIITKNYEEISFLTDTLIKVQIRGKEGLINTKGDWILNPVFDNLDEKDGLVLTLIDGKIGCYDPKINELIEAEYEARLTRIKDYYLAKKADKYGIIDITESEVLSFNYDEVTLWNDSTYLVNKDQKYWIVNEVEESLSDYIENVKLMVQNNDHKMFKYIQNGKYGLISNKSGILLDPEFTDIFNIGTPEHPLFFADQHLDKAGFHVVSYVDQFGELVISKAYTKDEFEKILCDD
ncbi:WG repeat-containing protein [Ekhidna sp.]|uniref:WG repeat-containing protein n=1 Tax=Ekhidna sp. TaxID=2608089 RepID=UPI003B508F24